MKNSLSTSNNMRIRRKSNSSIYQDSYREHNRTANMDNELFQTSATLTIKPDHGQYFNVKLPANEVLLNQITIVNSDPEVLFQLLLFDREQTSDYHNAADIFYEEMCQGRRLYNLKPKSELYCDNSGNTLLHGGIFLHERPIRFDMNKEQSSAYLNKPATIEITIEYQMIKTVEEINHDLPDITLETRTVVASFLKIKQHQRLKESTLMTYEKHFTDFEKTCHLLPISQEAIITYLSKFDGKSGRTRLNRQAELAMLYSHASEKYGITNPMTGLPRPKIQHKPIKSLSLHQVTKVNATPVTMRERAALDLLLGHGWRQIEIRRITAGDIRKIQDGMIWCRGKERDEYAPLLPDTQTRLETLAKDLNDEEKVFRGLRGELGENGMSKLIARLYKRAKLVGFHGHDLRRTFATIVREHSNDELLAMRLLRDQVPILNNRYLVISNAQLKDALIRYSPLRLVKTVSPSRVTGDCLVETGESRTPRPEEAV